MEFQYHGGNCITISTKGGRVVIDDNLKELGLKSVTKPDDIALFTQLPDSVPQARLVVTDPGEYEVSEISIFGVACRSHTDEADARSATIYKLQYGDTRVCIVGHIHPDVTESYLEELEAVDVLFIPVGGNGYTLDSIGAVSVTKKIEPRIVVPTHYDDPKLNYPVPQQPLEEAIKAFNLEPKEAVAKFKPKPVDYSEAMQLLVIERS